MVISLGSGRHRVLPLSDVDPKDIASHVAKALATDCEAVATELSTRLLNVDSYIRLNVDSKSEGYSLDDWTSLVDIEKETSVYLVKPFIARAMSDSIMYSSSRNGTATIGQISGSKCMNVAIYLQSTDQSATVKITAKSAPAVSSSFVLRSKEWERMVHYLLNDPSSNQKVFVITGMAGCGKTQMVSYFLQEKGSQ